MERLTITLGERASIILIAPGLLDRADEALAPVFGGARRIVVVTDTNVAAAQLPRLGAALDRIGITVDPIAIAPGEASKSWDNLAALTDALAARGVRRDATIVALGGGVVGDLVGLAAALHLRGCRLVQIPTSLVAQIDSSVGGKVAIDTRAGKNMVGAFHQPDCVLIDPDCLATLPTRELVAGYAELAKIGLIGDAAFFAWCEDTAPRILARDTEALTHAITVCVTAKARAVEADERDTGGIRALLNLGHSFAHAFEALAGYDGALIHGEAVAAGMVCAFALSVEIGLCDEVDARRVAAHLASVGLPTAIPACLDDADGARIVAAMAGDKKNAGDGLTLILTEGIGRAVVRSGVDPARVGAFIDRRIAVARA